ncbi:MAG: DUF885 family protein [Streptosporangiales bacterium]|nr:DUF885 family protein [Streptosporangiales bacterium]
MDSRLRAVCDLMVAGVREEAGLHEYDGQIQDLSPEGVQRGLGRVEELTRQGERLPDPHDEAHLAAFEDYLRVLYGELELHRRSPLLHLEALDLACYDREYAPARRRAEAKRRHLALWPDAVANAIASLDALSAPVAEALLPAVEGLAEGIPADAGELREPAVTAHRRLVAHLERAAERGEPDAALGAHGLARLMGSSEAMQLDLARVAEQADQERNRLVAMLEEAARRIDPERPPLDLARYLVLDHPDIDGVLDEARRCTQEAITFTRTRNLVPHIDGDCRVGLAPESRRWAMAMMTWAAPEERDAPSWYHITPPDPSWPTDDVEEWLEVFSATTLPAITVHEVAPGHFAHGRALRRASTQVRRILHSSTFGEGWAHYGEELCVEEGFLADDPRFAFGVYLEALVRVTRLACAIGIHTGAMTVNEAARRFSEDTNLSGPAALSEARRATFDPTYGRYTWGKLVLRELRERARARWGTTYSHLRFHTALLDLGSPPLGLLDTALDRG